MKHVPFNLERDFCGDRPGGGDAQHADCAPFSAVKSVKELIAFAKARPGQINFASPGVGSTAHLAMNC